MVKLLEIDFERVSRELGLSREQIANVVALLDDGNTVPFITRYRKERTGNLDEEQIRAVQDRVFALRQLAERADTILRLIEAQGKLTSALRAEIGRADSLKRLEDLYLPFRPKRRSRASAARERGLEPLADRIWAQDPSIAGLHAAAVPFIDAAKELPTAESVLQGASDILAERIGEEAGVRERCRRVARQTGNLSAVSAAKTGEEPKAEFRDYCGYTESVGRIPPHRVLALNRGENLGALRIRFEWDADRALADTADHLRLASHRFADFLKRCAADALDRLIQPSLEREIRRDLTERAEEHAVSVFARNLKNLLLQPPLRDRRVLAVDPGFRTGSKVAVLDEFGQVLATDVVYLAASAEKRAAARQKLAELIRTHECTLVAIGNGTACRETEEFVSELISESLPEVRYLIVNEAGASIYSTSTVARDEFPELDATARGTISIGRRLQDPLSELVKIDPQHIGVGMYQHDVNPKLLKASLDQVIESCVNYVGVDLNTASASLLRHVSGLNQLIARRVVEHREQRGRFRTRRQLLEVPGIGEATFTQAAGFLKIRGGDEPLDGTWIHPESYGVARRLLERFDLTADRLNEGREALSQACERFAGIDRNELATELQVGVLTLTDILDALARPGRDPRADLPGPVFRRGVLKLEDLAEGMELQGTVLNVVDFGAFVDIGVKDSALVHISQMSSQFVRNPHEVVGVGDTVRAWVLSVDPERRRVALTLVPPGTPRDSQRPPANARPEKAAQQPVEKPHRREPPPIPVAEDAAQGGAPLRGFDELKQLWKRRGSD